MKRSLRSWAAEVLILTFAGAALVLPGAAFGADVDPNQLLSFKRLFVEPAQDNVDGAFRDTVERAYREVLNHNPRFEKATSATESDAIVRTTLAKKTTSLELEIAMVLSATGEIFSQEQTKIGARATDSEAAAALKALLKTTLRRIPFYGTVTGRDGNELTFDIGDAHGLKTGDIIQISRIDNVKRHPLLKSVVDVALVPVGTAVVDQVEDTIAFGRVNTQVAGETVQRWHKVTAIEGRVADDNLARARRKGEEGTAVDEQPMDESDRPRLGYLSIGPFVGSFSGSTAVSSPTARTFSGSAFNPGAEVAGELWVTKTWFVDSAFSVSTLSYAQNDTSALADQHQGARSSTRSFAINGGYRYLPQGTVYGPQALVKLGYRRFSWHTGAGADQLLTSKVYSGLNLGLGGQLPLKSHLAGILLGVNILLFPSLTEDDPKTGGNPSASGVSAYFGGFYFLNPHISLRAGVQFEVYSADFNGEADTNQTRMGFVPSLCYYF